MKIYADPITVNCRKVLSGMQLMDVDYDLVHVDYFQARQKEADYVALNPNEALPALDDDGFVLWESNAMLQYAADKNGRSAFYPTDLQTRADINRWALWESSSWFPSCYKYLVENCVKPVLGAEADQSVLDEESANFNKLAGILDQRLADSQWLAGSSPTIADIMVAAPMHLHEAMGLPLKQHSNIMRWITDGVEKLPAWENTYVSPTFTLERPA